MSAETWFDKLTMSGKSLTDTLSFMDYAKTKCIQWITAADRFEATAILFGLPALCLADLPSQMPVLCAFLGSEARGSHAGAQLPSWPR